MYDLTKFWEWMVEKGYAYKMLKGDKKTVEFWLTDSAIYPAPPRMTIGCKIEYICGHIQDAFLNLSVIDLNCIINLDKQLNRMIADIK